MITNTDKVHYQKNGVRESPNKFYCRIKNVADSDPYIVEGMFMPNKLSPDSNANRRLDVFRCKMRDTAYAQMHYARSALEVHVEILRDSLSLINFTVPWLTRRTGYLMSGPSSASGFDAWRGLDVSAVSAESTEGATASSRLKSSERDTLYICSPGLETIPSRRSLPLYLEFVQHHLLLGADHIFLSVTFAWESVHMKRLRQVLRSYIEEGSVTLSSFFIDPKLDFQPDRLSVDNLYRYCIYNLAAGSSGLVGYFDISEILILKSSLPISGAIGEMKTVFAGLRVEKGRHLAVNMIDFQKSFPIIEEVGKFSSTAYGMVNDTYDDVAVRVDGGYSDNSSLAANRADWIASHFAPSISRFHINSTYRFILSTGQILRDETVLRVFAYLIEPDVDKRENIFKASELVEADLEIHRFIRYNNSCRGSALVGSCCALVALQLEGNKWSHMIGIDNALHSHENNKKDQKMSHEVENAPLFEPNVYVTWYKDRVMDSLSRRGLDILVFLPLEVHPKMVTWGGGLHVAAPDSTWDEYQLLYRDIHG